MKIYISGLYSGTNPQPGVGVVRSLRTAYPNASLIGVEYSNRCSGIHWHQLDDIWLQRPWEEMDLKAYETQIRALLDDGGFWISGVDLEIMWLASIFPQGHPGLLTPPAPALQMIAKPSVPAHRGLPVRIPEFISTEQSDWDLHAFCRDYGWKVWLKGPYYEAVRTNTWDIFERVRNVLSNAWSTERLFLQAHVTGYEESVCFCAYQGELLEAVYMRKRELTQEGKTWAGDVSAVPHEFLEPLREIVAELKWTGGAELEMVRDTGEQLWLLECNPRFPAWIHGATITGHNLPAAMVARASGVPQELWVKEAEQFTRVVLEIPVRSDFPLPNLPEPFPGLGHSQKHPSGTLALAERLQKLQIIEGKANAASDTDAGGDSASRNGDPKRNGNGHSTTLNYPRIPASFIDDVNRHDLDKAETPSTVFLASTAESLFQKAAQTALELSGPSVRMVNGYSIKTNPDQRLLRLALEAGFFAEAISLLEVQSALDIGFQGKQIILNGPGKWWPTAAAIPDVHAVFADSLADFREIVGKISSDQLKAKVAGVRLRPPNTGSRFGVPLDSPQALEDLLEAIKLLPRSCALGIHFH
ncbi:MAG: ATP-grasp domain-containing protein, partial [Pyrinomonadaceae bacterium]